MDWAAYEAKIGSEYNARRAPLASRCAGLEGGGFNLEGIASRRSPSPSLRTGSTNSSENNHDGGGRTATLWRNSEKQVRTSVPAPKTAFFKLRYI